jgi:uncharacterized membrane protein HdeD (DUF308 family)
MSTHQSDVRSILVWGILTGVASVIALNHATTGRSVLAVFATLLACVCLALGVGQYWYVCDAYPEPPEPKIGL